MNKSDKLKKKIKLIDEEIKFLRAERIKLHEELFKEEVGGD